jgi:hypothetical protein
MQILVCAVLVHLSFFRCHAPRLPEIYLPGVGGASNAAGLAFVPPCALFEALGAVPPPHAVNINTVSARRVMVFMIDSKW